LSLSLHLRLYSHHSPSLYPPLLPSDQSSLVSSSPVQNHLGGTPPIDNGRAAAKPTIGARQRRLRLSSYSPLPAPCAAKTSHPTSHPHNTLACNHTSFPPPSILPPPTYPHLYNKCRSQRCHLLWSKGTWRGVESWSLIMSEETRDLSGKCDRSRVNSKTNRVGKSRHVDEGMFTTVAILNEKSFRSLIDRIELVLSSVSPATWIQKKNVCRLRWSSLWWWVVKGTQHL